MRGKVYSMFHGNTRDSIHGKGYLILHAENHQAEIIHTVTHTHTLNFYHRQCCDQSGREREKERERTGGTKRPLTLMFHRNTLDGIHRKRLLATKPP